MMTPPYYWNIALYGATHFCIGDNTPIIEICSICSSWSYYAWCRLTSVHHPLKQSSVHLYNYEILAPLVLSSVAEQNGPCWHVSLRSELPVSLAPPNFSKICTFDALMISALLRFFKNVCYLKYPHYHLQKHQVYNAILKEQFTTIWEEKVNVIRYTYTYEAWFFSKPSSVNPLGGPCLLISSTWIKIKQRIFFHLRGTM